MTLTISVKEVANGFIFSTGKDDADIWVCEGTIATIDTKELGRMIVDILKANS